MSTHWECLDNCLFVPIMSWVLTGGVLSLVFLSQLCRGYSLGVSCQWSICLHSVRGISLECLDNCLFVFIGGVLSILYLSP